MLTPSISQRHIGALLNTILKRGKVPSPVRILDMGCGDGRLLAFLAQTLIQQNPECKFEFFGFEVGDIGWHPADYLTATVGFLNEQVPEHSWNGRISLFSTTDSWPYQQGSFDLIISNQVLEHVQEHSLVFGEIRRCLSPSGVSVNLFPLYETIYEVHAHMPLVHWMHGASRQKLMLLFARVGFNRKYKEEKHFRGWKTLPEFAAIYTQVLASMTNYKTSRQIIDLAQKAGLQAEFSYTRNFYSTKVLSILKRSPVRYGSPTWLDQAAFPVLKRLASVTLFLR